MEYKTGFCTFIDILGFKNIVKAGDFDVVKKIIDSVYSDHFHDRAKSNDYKLDRYAFSDSIIRVAIISEDYDFKEFSEVLINEIISIASLQLELLKSKILIRGGIAFGEVYTEPNRNILFGNPFMSAYELESQHALFPRIIIEPYLIEVLEELDCGNYPKEMKQIFDNLWFDSDGFYFIDYIKNSFILQNFLTEHKAGKVKENICYEDLNKIRNMMLENDYGSSNLGISKKYNWLANYFNRSLVLYNKFKTISQKHYDELFVHADDLESFKGHFDYLYQKNE